MKKTKYASKFIRIYKSICSMRGIDCLCGVDYDEIFLFNAMVFVCATSRLDERSLVGNIFRFADSRPRFRCAKPRKIPEVALPLNVLAEKKSFWSQCHKLKATFLVLIAQRM